MEKTIEYYITRCEQLVTENESLVYRLSEKDSYIQQLEKDRSALSVKANERIANLEEISGEHLKSARKNWDAYQMETDKTEKLQATLDGLLNLTDIESSEGAWKVSLEYDNSGDRAMVLDGDGNIIGECFDIEKSPNEQFLEAIDMAIKTVAKNDLEAIRTGITLL
jgi:predicted RNase H-like nuclease (RuvC/YqgF family)